MRSLDPRVTTPHCPTRATTRPRARPLRLVVAASLALGLCACSVSYPLFSPDGSEELKTGSVERRDGQSAEAVTPVPSDKVSASPLAPPAGMAAPAATPLARPAAYAPQSEADRPALTPSDWAYARGALSLAMGAEATNASVPWANPDSGAYGAFSAVAGATNENGATCRPFSASHSGGGREQRLEGTACRTAAGHWEAVAIRTTASRTL